MNIVRNFYKSLRHQQIGYYFTEILGVSIGLILFVGGFAYFAIFMILSEFIVFISESKLIKAIINGKNE